MMSISQTPTRPRRRRLQFSLLALIGIVAMAAVLSRLWLYEPARWDPVQIHVKTDGVVVDQRKTSWNDLAALLNARARRIFELGINPEAAIVRLSVDGEAVYADFLRAVEACRAAGLTQIHIRPNEDTDWFYLRPEVDPFQSWIDCAPYTIELKADANGDCVGMSTPWCRLSFSTERGRRTALDRLHKLTLGFVGPRTGPDSIRDQAYFELKCGDHLKFEHVAAVLRAMTENPQGSRVRAPIVREFAIPGGRELAVPRFNDALELELSHDLFLEPSDPIPAIDIIPPAKLGNPSWRGRK